MKGAQRVILPQRRSVAWVQARVNAMIVPFLILLLLGCTGPFPGLAEAHVTAFSRGNRREGSRPSGVPVLLSLKGQMGHTQGPEQTMQPPGPEQMHGPASQMMGQTPVENLVKSGQATANTILAQKLNLATGTLMPTSPFNTGDPLPEGPAAPADVRPPLADPQTQSNEFVDKAAEQMAAQTKGPDRLHPENPMLDVNPPKDYNALKPYESMTEQVANPNNEFTTEMFIPQAQVVPLGELSAQYGEEVMSGQQHFHVKIAGEEPPTPADQAAQVPGQAPGPAQQVP